MIRILLAILLVTAATSQLQAQSKPSSVRSDATRQEGEAALTRINGAGASIAYPLLSAWSEEYNHLHADRRVSYQAAGSGVGMRGLTEKTISFAVTSWAVSAEQLASANGLIVQFPVALNAVVPVYNLAQVPMLRLSGSTLAEIFLGGITRWDDAAIAISLSGSSLMARGRLLNSAILHFQAIWSKWNSSASETAENNVGGSHDLHSVRDTPRGCNWSTAGAIRAADRQT
jgi:phosphate transport system substrate-binding protein